MHQCFCRVMRDFNVYVWANSLRGFFQKADKSGNISMHLKSQKPIQSFSKVSILYREQAVKIDIL